MKWFILLLGMLIGLIIIGLFSVFIYGVWLDLQRWEDWDVTQDRRKQSTD